MSSSEITINVSGDFSQRVNPELCQVSFRVAHDSTDMNEALDKVSQTTNKISSILKDLAPHKAEATSASLALKAEPPIVDGFPVTKWSVQRIHQWSQNQRVTDSTTDSPAVGMMAARSTTTTYREETRHYVHTNMSATFHDFDKLEDFVGLIMREDTVNVDNLDWTVTLKTRHNFTSAVRAGAVKDALVKARDYAAALDTRGAANLRVVEINDRSGGSPVMYKAMRAAHPMAANMGGGQQERVSFEPEPVEVSAGVEVKVVL